MSEQIPPPALPPTNEPLRIAVRRLRWFKTAFHDQIAAIGARIGCDFVVDDKKLAAAFVRWLAEVEAQKPAEKDKRRAFFEFVSSLMLRELTADMPVKASGAPTKAAPDSAAAFWPEGYACTMFCLSVHAAAIAQEFHGKTQVDPAIDDLRQWWSFRENAPREARFSAGFLQMLLGHHPNWVMPDVFRARIEDEVGT
jgi:hypothetical protein